jgi:hypothetical protein
VRVLDVIGNPDRRKAQVLGHPGHFEGVGEAGGGSTHLALDVEPDAEFDLVAHEVYPPPAFTLELAQGHGNPAPFDYAAMPSRSASPTCDGVASTLTPAFSKADFFDA